jgi:hypothetical protein
VGPIERYFARRGIVPVRRVALVIKEASGIVVLAIQPERETPPAICGPSLFGVPSSPRLDTMVIECPCLKDRGESMEVANGCSDRVAAAYYLLEATV